ncbi:hypothetical protein [Hyalangium sp.]|uniref:hypothetical protein n=1 Tax=Hyalangium sp. TaxID=2028555 RepID=UPI002D5A597C|nr:hypothetical protein [Hyalangium sp.]HYI00326.1 hypothetical protein [Hyalangium sp.]
MATLRRGLVDKVKKAASKVSARGVQVAAKAGTRGARALVETTVAAVKTVDKIQEKLSRRPAKARSALKPMVGEQAVPSKARRATAERTPEAPPVEPREAGRKTMPTAAPKRSKTAKTPGKRFKVKRGQKHPHSGR